MPKDAMAKAFGKGGDAYVEPEAEDDMGGDMPPDYEAAYDEYAANPSKETFWAAVKACTEAYEDIGMPMPIGKGKPKN